MDTTIFSKKHRWPLVIGLFIIVVGGLGCVAWSRAFYFPAPNTATYQAVFLANGQAYFGKLRAISPNYVKLDDVHYLIANPQPNDTVEAERARKSQVIKLGDEVHQPMPYMFIPKRQILFWEDLKEDSRLLQGILSGQ